MKTSVMSLAVLLALGTAGSVQAAEPLVSCPPQPVRVVRSSGTATDYRGSVPGIPDLCLIGRADGDGAFYMGSWRSDWPGAGDAYPVIRAVLAGGVGARGEFVTRSVPGLQWIDTYRHEGLDPVTVEGVSYPTIKLAHERQGIEGNTYHSIITSWRDPATGLVLKVVEQQITGQSYGPAATWQAVRLQPLG